MNPMLELAKLKTEALAAVEESAKERDAARVVAAAEQLRELQDLEGQMNAICRRLERLGNPSRGGLGAQSVADGVGTPALGEIKALSARRKGDNRRGRLLDRLRAEGIELTRLNGVIYRTSTGDRVGIASASWNPKQPTRWFLGLPGGEFDHAILLCEQESDSLERFVLDAGFLSEHANVLSRDARGQVKFNVTKSGSSYFLTVPGRGAINIDGMRDDYRALRGS